MSNHFINTVTKQNSRRREEITTRHLTLINSRRGGPRALFIIFYFINRKKKLRSRTLLEWRCTFRVSRKQGSFRRVIFILLLLYSDLHCKLQKNNSSFTARTVFIIITVVKNKRKGKNSSARQDSICGHFLHVQKRYHKATKTFSKWLWETFTTQLASSSPLTLPKWLTLEICSKKPVKWHMHMETLLEEKVSDGLNSQLTTAEEIPQHSQMVFVLVQESSF